MAVYFDMGVRASRPVPLPFSHQPGLVTRIEGPVSDRKPKEVFQAMDLVGVVVPAVPQQFADTLLESAGDVFIRVEKEYPFPAGLLHAEVSLVGEAGPGPAEHAAGVGFRDFHRGVGAVTVDYDDVVGP